MEPIQIADRIHWVGALDPDLRDFHGFEIEAGTTYNSYLVVGDDSVALVDGVNLAFVDELLDRVARIVPLDSIDHFVVNHVEPDHAGGVARIAEALPNATVVCSAGAGRALPEMFGPDFAFSVVGPDDSIDLGGATLRFLPMPMVHWPDSMFTYVDGAGTLLSNDAFGQHLSAEQRWADEVGYDTVLDHTDLYFANILMGLKGPIGKALERVVASGWEIDTIAPSHGVGWRGEGVALILDHYRALIEGEGDGSVAIIHSTAWGSTPRIAERIAARLEEAGIPVRSFDLGTSEKSAVTLAVMKASFVAMGSPTLHVAMLPSNAAYFQYLRGLKPSPKKAGAFGSYGWSSGATKQIREGFETLGFDVAIDDLEVKYRPLDADLPVIDAWADLIVDAVK